jgi:hypothetical protein
MHLGRAPSAGEDLRLQVEAVALPAGADELRCHPDQTPAGSRLDGR